MAVAADRPRPRTPGIVYSAMSLVALIFVAAIALTTRQAPPPSIAEFAPQAVEQIKDAPAQQSSDFGTGEGGTGGTGEGGGPASTTTSTTAVPEDEVIIDVKRVRRCIGDPPRQIEDPQSPPCVNYFEGDNGGATAQGVTANEVLIAVPDYAADLHTALQNFFNARFEFYGRKIRLINTRGDFAGGTPEQQIAAAVKADEERRVFASLPASHGGGYHYHAELARRGVVSAVDRPLFSESQMQQLSPYLWQYVMANDRYARSYGSFLCARFANSGARFTSDPLLQGQPRKFGLIMGVQQPETSFDTGPLERELERCGAPLAVQTRIEGGGTAGNNEAQARDFVVRAKQASVTTVVCFCNGLLTGQAMRLATSHGYFPEWGVGTYEYQDDNFRMRTFFPSEHRTRVFGITVQPRQVRPSHTPVQAAVKESNPGAAPASNSVGAGVANIEYRALLLLASGIQMAGPQLTPEAFEKGLQAASFPNPDHPTMPGKVGFAGSHAMTLDAAEFFWSDTARSPYADEEAGSLCYVDGGARRRTGAYPSGDGPFFTSPCDSGA